VVIVEAHAGGKSDWIQLYAAPAAAQIVCDALVEAVIRKDAFAVPAAWQRW